MKLVTGVPVTCQQLVLAARAGKACVRSVCMYTCVWGCVSDGSVCVYVAVQPISIYKALSYIILERTRGETGEREGCAHFKPSPIFFYKKKKIKKKSETLSPILFRYYLDGILSF